ncbi:LppU/SCO3897 family protein [Micromonospora sp. NPDC003197]
MLICGAGGTASYLFGESQGARNNQAVDTPTSKIERNTPVASSNSGATALATVGPSLIDVRFVKVGECVKSGDDNETLMFRITECGPDTYQVLQRFEGSVNDDTDAEVKCSGVPGYTDWYFYKSGFDALDFVLCLKLR